MQCGDQLCLSCGCHELGERHEIAFRGVSQRVLKQRGAHFKTLMLQVKSEEDLKLCVCPACVWELKGLKSLVCKSELS